MKLFAVVALVALLISPASSLRAADVPLTKVTIQLNSVPATAYAPLYVAKTDGMFAKEGLDVEIIPGKTSQDAINTVAGGSVTMGISLAFTVILAADKGLQLVSIGSLQGRNSYGVVGAADENITSLRDLAGKHVLITGPVYETLLRALIKKAGGQPDATSYVYVPNPASLLGIYVAKQADAIETVLPFAKTTVNDKRLSNYIAFSDFGDPEPGNVFIVRPDILQTQKETIRKVLRVIYAAQLLTNRDSDRMVRESLNFIPGLTPGEARVDYDNFRQYQCSPTQKGKVRGELVPADWETTTRFFAQIGLLDHPVDPRTLYTNEFFEGPNPVSTVRC
jgi:ABC-type nitrate/sulfonate/bicarbonate transport system substrate-binding protein